MKKLLFSLILLILIPVNTIAKDKNYVFDFLLPYDGLLNAYVFKGSKAGIELTLVDYSGWAKDFRHQKAMEALKATNPKSLSKKEKLAFWINAYNLLTIDLIIQEEEPESIKNLRTLFATPWNRFKWEIGGQEYTLDQIEHEILRKTGEKRIHMAIVCASVSCPDLRREAYTVEKLERQLEDQTKDFLNNEKKGVEFSENELIVSPILRWYKEDFGDINDVKEFIRKYRQDIPKDAKIGDYLVYNWDLNGIF